jgi:hypothetical protein
LSRFLKNLCQEEIIFGIVSLQGVDQMECSLEWTSRFFILGLSRRGYYIKFYLCNKVDEFKWALEVVYGPAQDEFKESFFG